MKIIQVDLNKDSICARPISGVTLFKIDVESGTTEIVENSGIIRDELGRFPPGVSGHPEGRPLETQEQKIARKAVKEIIADYKEKLTDLLPDLPKVLQELAIQGDISAIKEILNRVMGLPSQPIEMSGGMSLEHSGKMEMTPELEKLKKEYEDKLKELIKKPE